MTATNSIEPAKDGTGASFNLTFAAESISGNKAQKTYVGSPATEGLIEPAQEGTDVTAASQLSGGVGIRGWLSGCFIRLSSILTAMGTPMQATGGTVGLVAGTALIGKAGIDQTTFGSTNAVTQPPSSSGTIALAALPLAAAASSLLLKASGGNLYDGYTATGATPGWTLIYDATSAPADGAGKTPKIAYYCPANLTTACPIRGLPPIAFTTGIVMVFSTTGPFTQTLNTTAFLSGRVA